MPSLQCIWLRLPLTQTGNKLTDTNKQETTYAALLPEPDLFSHLQYHYGPALLCFAKICITAAGLQGQRLTTAVLRDENRYISETSSRDVNWVLAGEGACSCLQLGETWRCCETSPKFPSSLGSRQQSPASVHAASWTLIQKHQVWLPLWHEPDLIQFNPVQQLAGTLSNKTLATGGRRALLMRGTMPTCPV